VDASRKNIRPTGKPRAAAVKAVLQIANERAGNNIARIIAELQAGGAASPQDIAAGLNQRGITMGRGGSWSAKQVARLLARRTATNKLR
jgi:Recombinase